MYYWAHWIFVNIIIRLVFRRVDIVGKENIPADGPLLMASNHPNGFFEPCVYACMFNFPIYFLVRGDLFEKRLVAWFLRRTHQIPIYRFKDGFAKLRDNTSLLSGVTDRLGEGKRILIFVEGSTKRAKRLRPLQKGIARFAFEALEETPDMPLKILPMGIHFSDSNKFREDIKISIGKPIDVQNYVDAHNEDNRAALKQLTSDVSEQLKKEMIHIPESKDEPHFDKLAKILTNDREESWLKPVEHRGDALAEEQTVVSKLTALEEDEKNELSKQLNAYWRGLKKMGCSDKAIADKQHWMRSLLFVIFFFPIATVGVVLNLIPSGITFLLSATVIPRTVYYGSLSGLSRLGVHFYIYYPILTIFAVIKFGWIGLLVFFIAPFAEWVFYNWWENLLLFLQITKLRLKPKQLKILSNQRADLQAWIKNK